MTNKPPKEFYTRAEVIALLERLAFHFSDNGNPNTDPHNWLNYSEGVDDGYVYEEDEDDDY